MKKLPAKAADALDLVIEFATLGEYGLEYPETGAPTADRASRIHSGDCRRRRHYDRPPAATRSKARRLHGRSNCRTARHRSEPLDFAEALRPPRITLDAKA